MTDVVYSSKMMPSPSYAASLITCQSVSSKQCWSAGMAPDDHPVTCFTAGVGILMSSLQAKYYQNRDVVQLAEPRTGLSPVYTRDVCVD